MHACVRVRVVCGMYCMNVNVPVCVCPCVCMGKARALVVFSIALCSFAFYEIRSLTELDSFGYLGWLGSFLNLSVSIHNTWGYGPMENMCED